MEPSKGDTWFYNVTGRDGIPRREFVLIAGYDESDQNNDYWDIDIINPLIPGVCVECVHIHKSISILNPRMVLTETLKFPPIYC